MPESKEYIKKRQEKQKKLDNLFLNIAKEISQMSYCTRAKVGCVLVKDGNIISMGYNGMPTGMDNCCEDANELGEQITRFEVLHAESNALLKATRAGFSTEGSTMYCTLSPCKDCSKLILQSGVKRVVYLELYNRDAGSVEFLSKFIEVKKHA
jgi:dCMP deaminase